MTKNDAEQAKGYSYSVTKEEIRRYMKVPAVQKLQWLEDANIFLGKALTGKRRLIWERFRRGDIG